MSFFRKPIREHVEGEEPTAEEIREAFIVWAYADQPCRAWCSRKSSGSPQCSEDDCWLESIIARLPERPA